jgi:hypothetical protein
LTPFANETRWTNKSLVKEEQELESEYRRTLEGE